MSSRCILTNGCIYVNIANTAISYQVIEHFIFLENFLCVLSSWKVDFSLLIYVFLPVLTFSTSYRYIHHLAKKSPGLETKYVDSPSSSCSISYDIRQVFSLS